MQEHYNPKEAAEMQVENGDAKSHDTGMSGNNGTDGYVPRSFVWRTGIWSGA